MKTLVKLIVLSLLFVSGCGENTAGERYSDLNNYLSGVLEEGKYIDPSRAIKIGKTQTIENIDWELLSCSTADVVLDEYWEGTKSDSIRLDWCSEIQGYIDQQQLLKIKERRMYRIRAVLPDGTIISAQTTIPPHINVPADSAIAEEPAFGDYPEDDNWLELNIENANQDHPLQVVTQSDDEINLYLEFYCLEDFNNARYIYPPAGNDYPEDEKEYMGDSKQYPRRNLSYYMYQPDNGVVNLNNYQSSIIFYGRTQICLYSIDDNYLSYLYKGDGYHHGGVSGGIGIFGSKSGKKLYSLIR